MKLDVKWGNHSFKGNAERVYLEITSIGDEVKPQQMVDYAEGHPDSELYKCFTWDNDVAADKWRLEEARLIHRNLVIKYVKEEKPDSEPIQIRATYRTSTAPNAGYKPIIEIMKNDDEYDGLLLVAKNELQSFKRKYAILKELKSVFDAIDALDI